MKTNPIHLKPPSHLAKFPANTLSLVLNKHIVSKMKALQQLLRIIAAIEIDVGMDFSREGKWVFSKTAAKTKVLIEIPNSRRHSMITFDGPFVCKSL